MMTPLVPTRVSARAVRRVSAVLLLLLALLGLGATTLSAAQTDDFDDGNDMGWTHYDPLRAVGAPATAFTFPNNNSYRIAASARPSNLAQFGQARAGSVLTVGTYTNFYIEVDLLDWNNTIDQAVGILARISSPGLGMTDGYAFTIQVTDTDISISRLTDEVPADLQGSSKNFIPDASKDYRMVFIGRGSHLIGRIYELPNLDTPVIETAGDDATYASGAVGLVIADLTSTSSPTGVGCNGTFDNFRVQTDEPPRLSIVHERGLQSFIITWPGDFQGFTLEYSTTLPATKWIEIPAGQIINPFEEPFPTDPNYKYYDFKTEGNRFYRLKKL